MGRERKVETPNSPTAEATAEANDQVEQEQAAAQSQETETPTPAPEFSDEQKAYLDEMMTKAAAEGAKAGYAQGRKDAAHTEAPAKTSASSVQDSKKVDTAKISKAVLTEVGWICPAPKPKKEK